MKKAQAWILDWFEMFHIVTTQKSAEAETETVQLSDQDKTSSTTPTITTIIINVRIFLITIQRLKTQKGFWALIKPLSHFWCVYGTLDLNYTSCIIHENNVMIAFIIGQHQDQFCHFYISFLKLGPFFQITIEWYVPTATTISWHDMHGQFHFLIVIQLPH